LNLLANSNKSNTFLLIGTKEALEALNKNQTSISFLEDRTFLCAKMQVEALKN